MKRFRLVALMAAAGLLAACATYTEKTSPCFGRNGAPQVTRAATAPVGLGSPGASAAKADCRFTPLPRPE